MWSLLVSLVLLTAYVSAAFCALRAAQTARTPQGSVAWVMFLLTFPLIAVPAYLFLGQHRFRGYRIARRESERVVEGIKAFAAQARPPAEALRLNVRPFESIAHLPVVRGNTAELLIDGTATFDAIFAAIDAARSYVLVQFYILRDDALGNDLHDRLIAAVERGVTVRVLTDAVGSYHLPESYIQSLIDAGIDMVDPHQQRGPNFRFQLNYRNHRKTVIVDGEVGFIGGHNVGEEYLGKDPKFGHWRDTHLRLTGPAVLQLQLIFVEDWHWARNVEIIDDLNWATRFEKPGVNALIVATGPGDRTETGSMMFFSAIAAAQTRIWIASPYFIPDGDIMTALKHAALRGVDVRVLVPDEIDHKTVWLAAFAYFDELCEAGARVWRYNNGFLHQKVFLIDDRLAAVGTTNLDNRSFRLNFEAMALVFDAGFAAQVETMLRDDFALSHELTRTLDLQPPHIRYGAPLARLLAPIL
ncbi:cardiolipin synthase [Ruegeria sp. 2012CJ41-6]|uniref:Cardiolipin synthase n=1 Tax=Ruegeria spongiae TaxID=2942209 RepID=A0ABT0PXG7_9RHOB|nr:cardiolipin synthase [Ruegeria spongiae]MCL6282072.1 cardiolipin synthase [Ruegeria spongiae]